MMRADRSRTVRTGAARVLRVRALGVASSRVQRRASCAGDGEEGSDRGEGKHFDRVYRNDANLSVDLFLKCSCLVLVMSS